MNFLEKTGKTVDEAIEQALKELNCTIDQVVVDIISPGSKGFLGFGSKKAKITVTKKFNPEEVAKNFIEEILSIMNFEVDIKTNFKDKYLYIDITGNNIGALIGKRGQTLDSLQYLVSLVVNKGNGKYINIILDIENYREKRKKTLESLALNLAKKVKSTKKSIVLEPMTSYERRIIHTILQNDKYVSTYSQGVEPHRNVVIKLK